MRSAQISRSESQLIVSSSSPFYIWLFDSHLTVLPKSNRPIFSPIYWIQIWTSRDKNKIPPSGPVQMWRGISGIFKNASFVGKEMAAKDKAFFSAQFFHKILSSSQKVKCALNRRPSPCFNGDRSSKISIKLLVVTASCQWIRTIGCCNG